MIKAVNFWFKIRFKSSDFSEINFEILFILWILNTNKIWKGEFKIQI